MCTACETTQRDEQSIAGGLESYWDCLHRWVPALQVRQAMKKRRGDALEVKQQLRGAEHFHGIGDGLGAGSWVRIRGETSEGGITVGGCHLT